MSRNFGKYKDIGIPPESTGPRIHNLVFQSVTLASIAGGTPASGDIVTGGTSGGIGNVVDYNAAAATILVLVDTLSPVQAYTVGESLTIGATVTATVSATTPVYSNATTLVSGDNPLNAQRVDARGGAIVRFQGGDQLLDAFGQSKFSQNSIIYSAKFTYDELGHDLSQELVGGGGVTHLPNESSINVAVGTASGDSVKLTTDPYFPYVPAVGRGAVFTLAMGDTGKTNNARRWGLYDDDDGVFFELDGTTLSVVVRTSTSGAPQETRIAQANWNFDKLDGSGGGDNSSLMNIDITKFNIYWIDYQWLGAGRVRFGVYAPSGQRIVCHAVENANSHSAVYMRTGSLPARWENVNAGITSGNSSMKVACLGVYNEAQLGPVNDPELHATVRSRVSVGAGSPVATPVLLMNIRTALTWNGITNRMQSIGQEATVFSKDEPVLIRVWEDATIGGSPGPVWNSIHAESPLEADISGAAPTTGHLTATAIVGAGQAVNLDMDYLDVHLYADGATSKTYSVTAECLGAGATEVTVSFSWIDVG